MRSVDAVVVGAGPNGLVAAITLARAGRRVALFEANERIGGGVSSAELTLPGYLHDIGSAVHPLGIGSPALRALPLAQYGVRWVHPPLPLAHPLDGRPAAVVERSVARTAAGLGRDAAAYQALMAPLAHRWERIVADALGPARLPRHPFTMAAFGARALWPARLLARAIYRDEPARALLAGICAHACLPLEEAPSAAFGLVLGMLAHGVGWPLPYGGAQRLADALGAMLRDLGGEIVTGHRVESLEELPRAKAVLCDVAPRNLLRLAGDRLPESYRRALAKFRHGPGIFKLDWALDAPIPWADPRCGDAGTLHLGGTLDEIAASERAPEQGMHHERPYVLLVQPSRFDPSRAPAGKHTAWAYCHIPHGSTADMTDIIEAQVERFAPGFRNRILARSALSATAMEAWNANLVGGDITGGRPDLRQLFTRPTISLNPYATPARGLYLCSASTPPGPGVHGLCGHYAAMAALRDGL
jgi:phytoene dehydrogenase-like protein